jgi:hypothetical protein
MEGRPERGREAAGPFDSGNDLIDFAVGSLTGEGETADGYGETVLSSASLRNSRRMHERRLVGRRGPHVPACQRLGHKCVTCFDLCPSRASIDGSSDSTALVTISHRPSLLKYHQHLCACDFKDACGSEVWLIAGFWPGSTVDGRRRQVGSEHDRDRRRVSLRPGCITERCADA